MAAWGKLKWQRSRPGYNGNTATNAWHSFFVTPGNGGLPLKDDQFLVYAQAQAKILAPSAFAYAQANADIKVTSNAFAQAQAKINRYGFAQAQCFILIHARVSNDFVEVFAYDTTKTTRVTNDFVEAFGYDGVKTTRVSNDFIEVFAIPLTQGYGQAQAYVLNGHKHAQAQAQIKIVSNGFGQAQCDVKAISWGFGQAQCNVKATGQGYGQAQADIKQTYNGFAQAQCTVKAVGYGWGQAQCFFGGTNFQWAQAQCDVKTINWAFSQAQCDVKAVSWGFAQAQGDIKATSSAFAQANADIIAVAFRFAQAQGDIRATSNSFGQAQGDIKATSWGFAQAQCTLPGSGAFAQAQVTLVDAVLFDTFSINTVGGMASPDVGPDWFSWGVLGMADATEIDGNLKIGINPSPAMADIGIVNADLYAVFSADNGNDDYIEFDLRQDNSGSGDGDIFVYTTGGSDEWNINVLGPSIPTGTDFADYHVIPGVKYSIRLRAVERHYQFKIWPLQDAEPVDWLLDITDDDDPVRGGAGFWIQATGSGFTYLDTFLVTTLPRTQGYGQANALIDSPRKVKWAQAQASIKKTTRGHAQALAKINAFNVNKSGNARLRVKVEGNNKSAQAQASIVYKNWSFSQAQATLKTPYRFAQAQAKIYGVGFQYAQAKTTIALRSWHIAQARPYVRAITPVIGQAMADIKKFDNYDFAQAQTSITRRRVQVSAQAQARVLRGTVFAQAQCLVVRHDYYAQAQAYINRGLQSAQAQVFLVSFTWFYFAQAQASILRPEKSAQAQAYIRKSAGYGQAQTTIAGSSNHHAQAQARINTIERQVYAQAQTKIRVFTYKSAQAKVKIRTTSLRYAQAQTWIKGNNTNAFAQVQAYVLSRTKWAQAQAKIKLSNKQGYSQAQAQIGHLSVAQAQCYIAGDRYLVKYNGYILPGYAQTEAISISNKVQDHYPTYMEGSLSEYIGLENKVISLKMKVFEETYLESKTLVQRAGTILNSARGWTPFYLQNALKHYLVLMKSVKIDNPATSHSLDYDFELEAKPWLIEDITQTLTGTGLLTATRTIDDGTWTPTIITVTGTNVTISGYTATEFTGYITISGAVTNFEIDSDTYTATNEAAINPDYQLYIGPGTTYISVTGATTCTVRYNNRWSL